MRDLPSWSLVDPSVTQVQDVTLDADANILVLTMESTPTTAMCPTCGHAAQRIRSRYHRTLADVAWALVPVRTYQQTPEFKAIYTARAGVEGTHAQGVQRCDLRHARYQGLAKTHLQHLASATALNLIRTAQWLAGVAKATPQVSPFARLRPQQL